MPCGEIRLTHDGAQHIWINATHAYTNSAGVIEIFLTSRDYGPLREAATHIETCDKAGCCRLQESVEKAQFLE